MKPPARLTASILLTAIAMGACAADDVVAPSERRPVVRAYLYVDEPVNDIRLTWSMTLDVADSIPEPINDAQVVLTKNGVRYPLVHSPGDSGYYHYAGSLLTVREGDVFDLEAHVGEQILTARTEVPTHPTGARVSSGTLTVPVLTFVPGGPPPDLSAASITVYWVRQPDALYYVTVQNIEAAPTAIDTTNRIFAGRRLVFSPTAADSFPIIAFSLTHYGRHRVRVYRVNAEYAQLYASRQQDSRDLNEPVTNIRGGLGVFSAFASDSTLFTAVAQ